MSDDKTAGSTSSASSSDSGSSPSPGGSESGKSSRESVGGKTEVHYGYFSNVRSREYKSGWDAIWGGKNGGSAPAPKPRPKASGPRKAAMEPVTVEIALDDLPEAAREALVARARAALKGSRISYDARAKAGAVAWRIACEVAR